MGNGMDGSAGTQKWRETLVLFLRKQLISSFRAF